MRGRFIQAASQLCESLHFTLLSLRLAETSDLLSIQTALEFTPADLEFMTLGTVLTMGTLTAANHPPATLVDTVRPVDVSAGHRAHRRGDGWTIAVT